MYKASEIPISANCELVLRTHFPDPPYMDLGRRSWKQTNRSTPLYGALVLELVQNDNARLTHNVLLSALAAVLLLRSYHRIRRLMITVLRASAMGNNWSVNRGQGSYHVEDASNTTIVSQMSTGSERAPTTTLRGRGLKKLSNYPNIWKAAEGGNVEDVRYHLEAGADINARNPSYGNPLSTAARNGRGDAVNFLISRGADVQTRTDIFTEAALHAAAEGGHKTIVAALLDNGADIDAKVGGIRPIYAAASKKHRSVVQFLLERGADPGILSKFLPQLQFSVSCRYIRCGDDCHSLNAYLVQCLRNLSGCHIWGNPHADLWLPEDYDAALLLLRQSTAASRSGGTGNGEEPAPVRTRGIFKSALILYMFFF